MTQTQSKQMARLAYEALEDKKARDIRILDISEISLPAAPIKIRCRLW